MKYILVLFVGSVVFLSSGNPTAAQLYTCNTGTGGWCRRGITSSALDCNRSSGAQSCNTYWEQKCDQEYGSDWYYDGGCTFSCNPTTNNCSTTACGSLCSDNCGGLNYGTYCASGTCQGQFSGAVCSVSECGTCNPGPSCPPACGSSCGGTCSGNGQACTINGPACPAATNTPVPCNIQGRKVIMPNNNQVAPAIGQTITVAGVGSTTNNSYLFTVPGGQNYTVTSSNITGYDTGYTVCTNTTGCHAVNLPQTQQAITDGSSVVVNCPATANAYVDLWWHYAPTKSCTVDFTPTSITTAQTVNVTVSGRGQMSTSEPVRLFVSKLNGTVVNPNNFVPPATEIAGGFGQYFYRFDGAECTSSNYATCSKTTTISLPTAGDYRFSCDVSTDPNKCSGNPFCTINGGTNNCSGWASCSGNDFKALTVTAVTPTPTSISTNVNGYHDGNSGNVTQAGCVAWGWATDYTNTNLDVQVRMLKDASIFPFWTGVASTYRSDLTSICSGGTCSWGLDLSSFVTPGVASTIRAQARDNETGAWVNLTNTPRSITCPVPTATPTSTPALCSVITSPRTIPDSVVGGPTKQVTAIMLSGQNGASITNMAFGSYNTSVATVSPANDTSSIYATNVTGVAAGSTAVWATATLSDGRTCPSSGTNDTDVTVSNPTPAPGCNVSLTPATASINQGASTTLTATVSGVVGTVDRVAFVSNNTAVATVSPGSDSFATSSQYTTSVTGVSGGSATVTATCYLTGSTTTARGSDSTTVTVVAPTLAPTVAPRVWNVTTAPVCASGGPVTTPLRMFRYLGPTTAPVYTQDGLAVGDHTMAISSNASTDIVWVGMKDASGNSYQPTSIAPSDPDVSFGQDFSPAVWTAQWSRGNLPAGNYTVNVSVSSVAPSAPTADSNPLTGNQVTLNWSPPLDWGFACASNNTYKVFMSPESAGYSGYPDNCTAASCTGAPLTTTASVSTNQTVTLGQRYCWAVVANNGSMDSVPSNFRCFDTSAVVSPWWQAVTGDAVAATGQVNSRLPGGEYLVETVGSGRPGMAFGESLGTDLNAANNISVNDWWSDLTGYNWSAVLAKPENGYQSMRNRLLLLGNPPVSGSPIQLWTGGTAVTVGGQQYYLYRANAPVSVSSLSNSGRKVILMVDGPGTTTLNANITFSAAGFGLILAEGNISLNSSVTALQGIYFAGNTFDTGAAANTLTVDGTVVGMGGVSLQRTGGGVGPSELFNFRPDYTMLLHNLGLRRKIVQELVNP